MQRALRAWALLALLALAALAVALASGSAALDPWALPRLLVAPDGSAEAEVLHALRLPRALAAFATGALLAVAGALMQVLLRNPLADPYVLGISGGAAAGALAALAAGLAAWAVQAGAFAGALLTIVLVFAIAHRDLARVAAAGTLDNAPRLLLTGVMLAAGWGAVVTLLLALAPEAQLRGMLFWLAGDLSGAGAPWLPLAVLAAVLAAVAPLARELNVLLRGPLAAASLGVRVDRLRRTLYALASLAAAVAVTTAGSIGFVGLVVPHALRLVLGNDQRLLLPACALAGGALLVLADTLARTVVAPLQLPVGVITALVGVPTFLVLLLRRGGGPLMLEAQALRVAAGGRVLVEGLELVVRRGEAWALVGPNGSGKTTLLHALAGVAPPAAGRVLLGGRPYADRPPGEAACLRGLLPQALVDSFPASVLETVLVGRHPHLSRWAWEAADDVAVAQASLEAMDLAGLGARDVTTLSGGERQRVALAALLAQDPLLLLLDEPLAHLDPHHQMTVLRVLRERVDAQGRALVFSVHDLHLAARFATHALVIGPQGHRAGPADEVLDEATLAGAFGHAIRRVRAEGQWLFVPA